MKMNGKKGFIAVTLVMATILIGYFAPGWYTWTVHYTINPLTSFEELDITKTTGGTFGVQCWPDYGYETVGGGNVWLEDSSVGLYVLDGSKDWAGVDIGVDIALKDIAKLSFWEYIESYTLKGWDVNVILGIDADGDDVFEADIPGWHIGPNAWTLEALKGDTFIEMDGALGGDPSKGVWTQIDALPVSQWWTPDKSGAGFAKSDTYPWTFYDTFDKLITVFIPDSTQTSLIPNVNAHVKLVKLLIGGSINWQDETAYVRGLSLNDKYIQYAEQIQIDQPLWVVFGVSRADIEALLGDYQCIGFSIHILDKATGELVYVLILPLIVEIAGVPKPAWELPAGYWPSGPNVGGKWSTVLDMALVWINLEPGEYGVIKDVIYWTEPITTEVFGSFTVCVFAIEKDVFKTWDEHLGP